MYGSIYFLLVNSFVFMDALKVKSRKLVIVMGSVFALLHVYHIYNFTFGNASEGVLLFKYTIDGKEHSFMKRSTKRSIFVHILLFGIAGMYTIIVDKKQERLLFVTGNVYRETGTTSKEVEDTQYLSEIKRERVVSSAENNNNDGSTNIL